MAGPISIFWGENKVAKTKVQAVLSKLGNTSLIKEQQRTELKALLYS